MADTTLADLLERNAAHAQSLPVGYFSAVETSQSPAAVSVCCSDSRVSQEGMWNVRESGWLFTPSNIGNQVWDERDGELVVDGSVLYPLSYSDTEVALVVGHTGCGAVTAALDAIQDDDKSPADLGRWVEHLVPIVTDGLDDDRIGTDADASLVDQLVEYNVDRQVAFLQESQEVPPETDIYGFVYDFQGVYGETRGRAYLVNANGETETDSLRELVPGNLGGHVDRLL
jgi:carbonic anhydrase